MIDTSKVDANSIDETGWTYIRYVVDMAREPFLILDENLRILSANDAFYKLFLVKQEETEQKLVYELGNGEWNIPQLRKLLEDILPKSTFFKDFEVEHEFPSIGKRIMMVNARILINKSDEIPMVIMAMEDVTVQRLLDEKLKEYTKELEVKVSKRTGELEGKIQELEKMNESMVDRELKMIELKKEMEVMRSEIKALSSQDALSSNPTDK